MIYKAIETLILDALVAQSVERVLGKDKVASSILAQGLLLQVQFPVYISARHYINLKWQDIVKKM